NEIAPRSVHHHWRAAGIDLHPGHVREVAHHGAMDETGAVDPLAFGGGVREHGDEAEVVRLPALRNVEHVEIALCAATPIQRHFSFDSPLQGALAHRLDRREAGAARHHDDRLVRLRSEEHTSELQSLPTISYAVFC